MSPEQDEFYREVSVCVCVCVCVCVYVCVYVCVVHMGLLDTLYVQCGGMCEIATGLRFNSRYMYSTRTYIMLLLHCTIHFRATVKYYIAF